MSKATKHTPGPWVVDDDNEGTVYVIMGSVLKSRYRYQPQHKVVVVEEMEDGKQLDEAFANAHLIAAAPDLLAALEALVTEWGGTLAVHAGDPKAEAARAALAKAKGEKP